MSRVGLAAACIPLAEVQPDIPPGLQVGYGNYVMQSNCSSVQPVYQQTTDPLLSPVPLVANHFGADYHLTAWAASGLTASLQGSPNLPAFWTRGDAINASSSWNFSTWQPQVRAHNES